MVTLVVVALVTWFAVAVAASVTLGKVMKAVSEDTPAPSASPREQSRAGV